MPQDPAARHGAGHSRPLGNRIEYETFCAKPVCELVKIGAVAVHRLPLIHGKGEKPYATLNLSPSPSLLERHTHGMLQP